MRGVMLFRLISLRCVFGCSVGTDGGSDAPIVKQALQPSPVDLRPTCLWH